MVKSLVLLLCAIGMVATISRQAAANKHCAPLAVQIAAPGPADCKCVVQNYSTSPDTGVTINVYAMNGGYTTCGPFTLPARTATFCHVSIALGTTCGCVVTGEGALTLASLSVMDPTTGAPQVALECR